RPPVRSPTERPAGALSRFVSSWRCDPGAWFLLLMVSLATSVRSAAPASSRASHVREHALERLRSLREVECVYEQAGVADFAPATAAHEAAQLLLAGTPVPGGLLLQGAKRPEIALRLDDLLDRSGA